MSKLSPRVFYHPFHPILEKHRKNFPREVKRFETLLKLANNSSSLSCFTCQYYSPLKQNELGVENPPWKSEDSFVHCKFIGDVNNYTSLRINCPYWTQHNHRLLKKEE